MLVAGAVTEGRETASRADLVVGSLIGALGVIGLAGCIVSWWRERLAAVLLVLTASGYGVHIGVYAERNHFLVWSIVGFPYLAAALLFFYSGWLSRKTSS